MTASFSCAEGAGGPGLKPGSEGCSGTVANGAAIDTSTAGEHHFTVIATSQDGLTTSKTVTYTVAAPPTLSITTPAEGAGYLEGQTVSASYSCAEGAGGPGLKPGSEGCSGTVANGAAIDTSTAGEHHFTVTATSKDGQSTAKTVNYTVVTPPIFGRCLKAKGEKVGGQIIYHGEFTTATCTEKSVEKTGKFEWSPGLGPKPGFKLAIKPTTTIKIETPAKHSLVWTGFTESKGKQVPNALEGGPTLFFEQERFEPTAEPVIESSGLGATILQTYEEKYEINTAF